MKRIIMQASAMVVFVFSVAMGVNAQSAQQYRAEIPFGFDAAGRHYAAGEYSVGPMSQTQGPIAIQDLRNGKKRMLGVNSLGGTNDWDKVATLTFRRINGRYRLSQISTPTFNMELKVPKVGSELAGTDSSPETVAINLKK